MGTYTIGGNVTTFTDKITQQVITHGAVSASSTHLPSSRTTKILCIGDSITYGVGGESYAGYRGWLWTKLWQHGYKFQFVGPNDQPPSQPYPEAYAINGRAKHYGNSGWTVRDIRNLSSTNTGTFPTNSNTSGKGAKEHVVTYTPDIALIHAGTNGVSEFPPSALTSDMNGLLDDVWQAKSDLVVFLAQIIGKADYNDHVTSYNASIATIVSQRQAAGKQVVLVPMQQTIPMGSIYNSATNPTGNWYDAVHLSSNGYKLMADAWFAKLTL